MQWYKINGFYKKRFLREIQFIEKYNENSRFKMEFGFTGDTKLFVVKFIYQYKGGFYLVKCVYPRLYPKVRIAVKVFKYNSKVGFKSYDEGYHNSEGIICYLNHYPNRWNEDYGIEYIINRVAEWFDRGQYDPNNNLPIDYYYNRENFIFTEPLGDIKQQCFGLFEFTYFNDKACMVSKVILKDKCLKPHYLPSSFKSSDGKTGRGIVIYTTKPVLSDLGSDISNKIKTYMNHFSFGAKGFFQYANDNGIEFPIPLVVINLNRNIGQAFTINQESVEVCRFTSFTIDGDIFSRIKDANEIDFLRQKKVAVIGLGALGSVIATELARSGVRNFVLIDYEKLEIQNIGRHDLTIKDIDRYKVDAVKEKILDINPAAKCLAVPFNVLDDYSFSLQSLLECDLVISTMDDQEAKYAVDSTLIPHGKKVIYTGVFYNAVAGYVLVSDKRLSCFKCQSILIDDMAFKKQIPDFSQLVPEDIKFNCGLPTFPGGSINSHTVALLAAKVALDTLLQKRETNEDNYPFNFYLLGNDMLSINESKFFTGYMDIKKYVLPGIIGCTVCDKIPRLTEAEEQQYEELMEKLL